LSTVAKLHAKPREVIGKSSHRLAGEGIVPAVVYGPEIDTMSISIDRRELERLMHDATVGATLVDLVVEGHKSPLHVIIKEIKHEEVKGAVQHVDFWAVKMSSTLQTVVGITFVGSAEGERSGGVVMHALRELHVEALPKDLPEHIEVDLSSLQVGDSVTVGSLTAPAGVTVLDDPDAVIASVMAPTAAEEEVVEVTEVTEVPEVGKESAAEAEE